MQHDEKVKMGLRLNSIDDLTPRQWASVTGLTRGRAKYDEYMDEKRREEVSRMREQSSTRQ